MLNARLKAFRHCYGQPPDVRRAFMAREYTAKGDAMEKEAEADPPPSRERTALPNVGRDDVG